MEYVLSKTDECARMSRKRERDEDDELWTEIHLRGCAPCVTCGLLKDPRARKYGHEHRDCLPCELCGREMSDPRAIRIQLKGSCNALKATSLCTGCERINKSAKYDGLDSRLSCRHYYKSCPWDCPCVVERSSPENRADMLASSLLKWLVPRMGYGGDDERHEKEAMCKDEMVAMADAARRLISEKQITVIQKWTNKKRSRDDPKSSAAFAALDVLMEPVGPKPAKK